jgi:hypothetical protein
MYSGGTPLFFRITLLDIVIAKLVGEEQLTKDDISIFVRHAELIANSFMDQCRNVLKLTSEPHTEDKVRTQIWAWRGRADRFSSLFKMSMRFLS